MAQPVLAKEKVVFQKDLKSFLTKGLLDQRESGELCDVILRLNGRSYPAHKAVLAASSPYFYSMFTSHMREKCCSEVDLSESLLLDYDEAFKTMVTFMYSGDIELSLDNAVDILRVADFLLMDCVKEYCRQFFIQYGNLKLSNCISLSLVAAQHQLEDVAEKAQMMVEARFHDYLIKSEEILELPGMYIQVLLQNQTVTQFTSQEDLLKFSLKWVRHDENERKSQLDDLLKVIDLTAVPAVFLQTIAEDALLQDSKYLFQIHGCTAKQVLHDLVSGTSVSHNGHEPIVCEDGTEEVLVGVVCNPERHFMKIVLYCISEARWYNVPITERATADMPYPLTVTSIKLHDKTLYMFLSQCAPYPSDMVKINVMSVNMQSGLVIHQDLFHRNVSDRSCRTTLGDNKSLPPVLIEKNKDLYMIGNKEGAGHLFICDLWNQEYDYYIIPGVRIVRYARACLHGSLIYLWLRHGLGNADYIVPRTLTFTIFDCKTRTFNSQEIPAPDIAYEDFTGDYILTATDKGPVIHCLGRPSLWLNEQRQWTTIDVQMPALPVFKNETTQLYEPLENWYSPIPEFKPVPMYGFQFSVPAKDSVFVLRSEAAYVTSMFQLQTKEPKVCM